MALSAGQIPKLANVLNGGVAVLTGTTIGTLGSNTNGVTGYTAGSQGGRVISILGTTDDTATINVYVYILRSSTVLPIGMVNIPLRSGDTNAARFPVDFLNGTNLPGLPVDNTGRQYISLLAGDVLRFTTLVNLNSAKYAYITVSGLDYQA